MALRFPGTGEAVSHTELEFAEATNAGLPRLVFLLDTPADDVPDDLVHADRAALEAFQQRLRRLGRPARRFTTIAGWKLTAFHAR